MAANADAPYRELRADVATEFVTVVAPMGTSRRRQPSHRRWELLERAWLRATAILDYLVAATQMAWFWVRTRPSGVVRGIHASVTLRQTCS